MKLSHRRFVIEYLKDGNGTEAVLRSGAFKCANREVASDTAGRLLAHAGIRSAIESGVARRALKVEVKTEDVLRELVSLSLSDPSDAFDAKGVLRPPSKMPEDVRRSIVNIETVELFDNQGKKYGEVKKVKFTPKEKVLEQLAKHLGMFDEGSAVAVERARLFAAIREEFANEPETIARWLRAIARGMGARAVGGLGAGAPGDSADRRRIVDAVPVASDAAVRAAAPPRAADGGAGENQPR